MNAHRAFLKILPAALCVSMAIPAISRAAGINLSWDDCGPAGVSNKDFACETNSGGATLIGSFVAPSGINALVGIYASLDLWSSPDSVATAMPDWWQIGGTGCRSGSISTSYDFVTGPYSCIDPWGGAATGGQDYALGVPSSNHARLRLIGAVPVQDSVALTENGEYYAFRVYINFHHTAGSGACRGCDAPVSIALSSMTLSQPAPRAGVVLNEAANSNVATWQGGVGLSPNRSSPQAVTYGQIRGLFR